MSEPNLVRTLRTKRDAIERAISAYEAKLEACRRDLSHVNAVLALYAAPDGRSQFPVHMDTKRLFKPREISTVCKDALAREGPLDTRQLALVVIRCKGMDESDAVLRATIAYRITQALNMQAKRGSLRALPKRKGVRVWALL